MTSRNSLQHYRSKASARPAAESKPSHPSRYITVSREPHCVVQSIRRPGSRSECCQYFQSQEPRHRTLSAILRRQGQIRPSRRLDQIHYRCFPTSVRNHADPPLGQGSPRKPATANRILATLRHATTWIHERRPFLAGNPCRGIRELVKEEPAWKGLSDIEVMRLRSASEQLAVLKTRRNQHAARDRAIFLVLLHTGLRISELLALNRDQYQGKHFIDVRRKGEGSHRQSIPPA